MKYDYMLTVIIHIKTDALLSEDELSDKVKTELNKVVEKDYLELNNDYHLTGIDTL